MERKWPQIYGCPEIVNGAYVHARRLSLWPGYARVLYYVGTLSTDRQEGDVYNIWLSCR